MYRTEMVRSLIYRSATWNHLHSFKEGFPKLFSTWGSPIGELINQTNSVDLKFGYKKEICKVFKNILFLYVLCVEFILQTVIHKLLTMDPI